MPHPLITAHELSALLAQSPQAVRVLDCRFNLADPAAGETAWRADHVPGAVYAHLDRDLSGRKTGQNGRHPLPDADAFGHTLSAWGISPTTRVVAYDASGGMFAARLWWMCSRWLGHTHVQVLDGGWGAWLAHQARPDASDAASNLAPAADAAPHHQAATDNPLVDTAQVLASLSQTDAMWLLDARAPDRFRGENETLDPVGGHIPGAHNRFFQLNLAPDGRFKPAEQLRAEFDALLAGQAATSVVHQCGSGVTACHNVLAMAVAGLEGSRLYAGSWSAWCAAPARPVAR
jgi:thiosulfate/3-mercaptopyruvate sulfurtransferase